MPHSICLTGLMSFFVTVCKDNKHDAAEHADTQSRSRAADLNSMFFCSNCNSGRTKSRNLVVCIDGTSNQFGPKNTNVVELYNHLENSADQFTYYNSGIGTFANVSDSWLDSVNRQVYSIFDLAFARSFDKNIRRAYRWLTSCYEDGDRIFLFGFSRGAWQVRTLAGMLHKVGLLHKGNEDQIPFAYAHYKNTERDRAEKFKKAFSRTVRVHFVGVWDTVSSVGITRSKNFPGTDTTEHICVFRHALALDERRVKFLPEYVRGGEGPQDPEQINIANISIPPVKEVWFAGSHSDIGGGRVINENLDGGSPPLRWMIYEAALNGLRVTVDENWMWNPWEKSSPSGNKQWTEFKPSPLAWRWRWINYLPIKRLTYHGGGHLTRRPLMWRDSRIMPYQKVHYSTAFLDPTKYIPNATPPPHAHWNELVGITREHRDDVSWKIRHDDLWEVDVFDNSMGRDVVEKLQGAGTEDMEFTLHRLKLMAGSSITFHI
ncbi:hypothetical protein JB92DRAFT_1772993 [Gautieria morchelliformis]|nr:hypothetical protein JB92DRAFT_1772993 [Gautieria morchelliformis]